MEQREKLTEFVIDDCAYLTRLTPKFANRKVTPLPDPSAVRAVVPGTILRVLAEAGQSSRPSTPPPAPASRRAPC
ncbi:MAG: hypothetical protein MUE73_16635 [Planctomycetes bacterium]|nr:hypothetical protein [Planctomycetota bacterium]